MIGRFVFLFARETSAAVVSINQEEEEKANFQVDSTIHAKYMQSSFQINMQMRLANRRRLTNGWKLSAWPGGERWGEVGRSAQGEEGRRAAFLSSPQVGLE